MRYTLKCQRWKATTFFIDSQINSELSKEISGKFPFKGIAQRGKCSLGWFYGFKLHLICNDKGEILNFMITPGDVDDREPLKVKSFVEFIYGKLVGDKGYISQNLFNKLFVDGIQLKNNMKGGLRPMYDRILLRKRAIIETINDSMMNSRTSPKLNIQGIALSRISSLTWLEVLPLTASSRRNQWSIFNESMIIRWLSFDYFRRTHVIISSNWLLVLQCQLSLFL